MRLEPIAYMTWAKAHVDDESIANLASSGIRGLVTDADLLEGLERIPILGLNSDGLPALRDAIAARYRVPPENVLTAEGASGANFLVLASWIRPGDRVLLEEPYYEPIGAVLRALEARIVLQPIDGPHGHAPILETLKADTAGFRAVVLTNPQNPTAAVVPDATLVTMADACEAQDGLLIVDEAYRELLGEDPPGCAARAHPAICVTSSLTKPFGLSALRIGWGIGPPELIERAKRIHDNLGVNHPYVSESLGARLLANTTKMDAIRARLLRRVAANRAALARFFEKQDLFEGGMPPHGILAFPRWKGTPAIPDADTLCRRALAEAQVALVPGRFFDRPDHV
ncbi:MAG: pyridoxal phosphate-dependent aminotransferase, partial [Candidatus Eisenbacteria bacterium]|nr:pyridoxal phosphate-dependent aminotransferase [Candidatus Eisenbacteria bacterium]